MNTNLPAKISSGGSFGSIFKNIFRRNIGISLLYAVLCFVSYPMILFLIITASSIKSYSALGAGFGFVTMGALAILFSMILTTRLFGFMHTRSSVDVYHSLPVRRERTFWVNYLIGLIFILVPFILNSFISLLMYKDLNQYILQFLQSLLFALISITEFYTFCVFFHVTCGSSFGANLYNLLLNFCYVVGVSIIALVLSDFLPGFEVSLPLDIFILFSPISGVFTSWAATYLMGLAGEAINMWIHLAVAIIVLLISFFLYRIRKSEKAGSTFAFSLPKHILRFVVTSSGALFFSMIFYLIDSENISSLFLGAFIGGALTHIILEIIFSKGFGSIIKSLPALGVFYAVFVIAYIAMSYGWFGYDVRMPASNEIKSVTLNANINNYMGDYEYITDDGEISDKKESKIESEYEKLISDAGLEDYTSPYILSNGQFNNMSFSDPENFEYVMSMHRTAIQNAVSLRPYHPGFYNDYKSTATYRMDMSLTYILKNGKTLKRSYYCVPVTKEVMESWNALCNSKETQLKLLYPDKPEYTYSYKVLKKVGDKNILIGSKKCDELIKCLKPELEAASTTEQKGSNTIDVAIFITTSKKITASSDEPYDDINSYNSVKLVRLTIDPVKFPKAYACLNGDVFAESAA